MHLDQVPSTATVRLRGHWAAGFRLVGPAGGWSFLKRAHQPLCWAGTSFPRGDVPRHQVPASNMRCRSCDDSMGPVSTKPSLGKPPESLHEVLLVTGLILPVDPALTRRSTVLKSCWTALSDQSVLLCGVVGVPPGLPIRDTHATQPLDWRQTLTVNTYRCL